MNSSIDNSVNLGGTQKITSKKLIKNNGLPSFNVYTDTDHSALDIQADNIDVSNPPASGSIYSGIMFLDKNGQRIAKIEPAIDSTGGHKNSLGCSNFDGTKYNYASISVGIDSDNKISYNFGQKYSGQSPSYYKIPTGKAGLFLLVCFGYSTGSATFPLAYTSTPRVVCSLVSSSDAGYVSYIGTISTTSFTILRHGVTSGNATAYWISIGFRQE